MDAKFMVEMVGYLGAGEWAVRRAAPDTLLILKRWDPSRRMGYIRRN